MFLPHVTRELRWGNGVASPNSRFSREHVAPARRNRTEGSGKTDEVAGCQGAGRGGQSREAAVLKGLGQARSAPPPQRTHFICRDIRWNVCHREGTFMSQCTTGLICKETKEAQKPGQAHKRLVDTDITHSASPKPKGRWVGPANRGPGELGSTLGGVWELPLLNLAHPRACAPPERTPRCEALTAQLEKSWQATKSSAKTQQIC